MVRPGSVTNVEPAPNWVAGQIYGWGPGSIGEVSVVSFATLPKRPTFVEGGGRRESILSRAIISRFLGAFRPSRYADHDRRADTVLGVVSWPVLNPTSITFYHHPVFEKF